ncbi:hypothetical protein [Polymorphobacter sp.]|uniref:hypothetical protein n=1 Tax=Polymorphobacter sp. TaxID=1909290 RepID=UPI003F708F87
MIVTGKWMLLAGLLLLVLGCGPLLLFIVADALGLVTDPDPNPIGLGLLAFVSFWPGVILTAIGLARRRR